MVSRNSIPGGFAYIWQSKWLGIIAIKNESTQINFLSDVLVAVASLDLKVPNIKMNYSGTPLIRSLMGQKYFAYLTILTGWPYYRGRLKLQDLRAVMTNTLYIAFTFIAFFISRKYPNPSSWMAFWNSEGWTRNLKALGDTYDWRDFTSGISTGDS